jgi:hypothetical protein
VTGETTKTQRTQRLESRKRVTGNLNGEKESDRRKIERKEVKLRQLIRIYSFAVRVKE